MTFEQFQDRIDGCINDYITGISNGKEFRDAIMNVMLEVMGKHLEK